MNREIADMRENYAKGELTLDSIVADPIDQFKLWFDDAKNSQITEPNAMILATVNAENIPSARTVLLKEIDSEGFIFYTNYTSDKGRDIEANANVSIVFLWKELERQIRISGKAEKISPARSEKYFHMRPKGSQIGAWVSPQSDVIESREVLEKRKIEIESKFSGLDQLPLPDFWGGYIVKPTNIEFWQGRPSRLHDRLKYRLEVNKWIVERLAP